eukprot:172241-Chlamydomonas_euryale.AAC.1
MMLWTMPPPPAPQQQQQPPARDADLGVIGYCMMTFVIRNGLKALSLGRSTYHNYVTNLARTWGLPQDKQAQVCVCVCVCRGAGSLDAPQATKLARTWGIAKQADVGACVGGGHVPGGEFPQMCV